MPRLPNPPGTRMPSASASFVVQVGVLGVDPVDLEVDAVVDRRVAKRFGHRQVCVVQLHVLADQGDPHRAFAALDVRDEVAPVAEVGGGRLEAKQVEHNAVQALLLHHQRHHVDVGGVDGRRSRRRAGYRRRARSSP